MKEQPIEAVMWRTLKILRRCDYDTLLAHINMTHPCTDRRLSRYLNHLIEQGFVKHAGGCGQYALRKGSLHMTPSAPAVAPIFRKGVKYD